MKSRPGTRKDLRHPRFPQAFTKSALRYYVFSEIGGTLTKSEANRPVSSNFHVPLTLGTATDTSWDIGTRWQREK